MKKLVIIAALVASVTACAKSPSSIEPVSMGNAFAAMPCNDTRVELFNERQKLAALEAQQKSAVTGDAIGVFLIGIPVSSMSGGDQAGAIAASKGKVISLEAREANCKNHRA